MIVSTRRWLGLGLLAVAALLLLGSVFEGQFLAGSGERRTASPQHLDEPPQPISQPPTVLQTPAPPAPGIMTVLKGVGSALGGLLARFRRKAAEFLSEQRALVCVVGSARTFALPCVHESIYTNVVQSLRSDGSEVDVHVLLSFQDHTKRRDEHRNCTVDASGILRGMSLLAPLHGLVVPDSSCSSLQRSFDGAACEPTGLQLSWIDKCFQLGRSTDERQYTHYFRIRPDAFFASPIGALRTFEFKAFKNEKNIVTTIKTDAPGNDQFFAFGYYMYDTWWRSIREQLDAGKVWQFSPEYNIFNHRSVKQEGRIASCLARRPDLARCWSSRDLATPIDEALKRCSSNASSQCGLIGKPLEVCDSSTKSRCSWLNPLNPTTPKLPHEEYEKLLRGLGPNIGSTPMAVRTEP